MDKPFQKVPVFVFPLSLKFFVGSRDTHKQLLTIYNPYDFAIKFRVMCTAPNKYMVIDPEGSIAPQCMVDLVVRHTMPVTANCGIQDKFRVVMQDHVTKQVLGKREISAELLPGENDISGSSESIDRFEPLPISSHQRGDMPKGVKISASDSERNQPNYIAVAVGVVCITALFLPTQAEPPPNTPLPEYLHLSANMKLVFAFVLGLVTMVILKP